MSKPCRFPIDFFEFSFLVEACIPPVPIARGMFWNDVIDKHYHTLTEDERTRLYTWIGRNDRFNIENEYCALFDARFNPNNQWKVTTNFTKEPQEQLAFKWNGNYHISSTTFIAEEFISKVEKISIAQ